MAKSLRLRLQFWHATILLLVIVGFGAVFYVQLQRTVFVEIDADLLSNARVLEGALRSLPPGPRGPRWSRGPGGPPGINAPPRLGIPGRFDNPRPPRNADPSEDSFESPALDRSAGTPRRADRPTNSAPRPGADFVRPQRPPPENEQPWLEALELPPSRFSGPGDEPPYFIVFSENGQVIRQQPADQDTAMVAPTRPIEYRHRDADRQVWMRGPHGTTIVVGRDIHRQIDRLRGWLIQLCLSGSGVLVVGLLGGWWLSGTAIRPIQDISQTASTVTASNLGQRIDTQRMDRELLELTTVLNAMLDRIEHSFDQQTQFTANASHELRTPLAVLLSHCELALSRERSPAEYQETIATCQRASRRMQALVEDLLVLARVDSGNLDLQLSPCDLQKLASETIELFKPLAAEQQIELVLAGDAACCQADERRIAQVLANLVSNAIQYNHPGGRVTLTTTQEPDFSTIHVQDTGRGIAESHLPQLFDRFYRVDEARSRAAGGSGLGLAICKSIVELHGGQLTVESQIGQGSTFSVRLSRN
jgi:two-component system OmpR family sensor kinase